MPTPTNSIRPVGIATSVSAATGFDPIDTLSYAIEHGFPLVQAYLNDSLCTNSEVRRSLVDLAARHGVSVIAHAPGLLVADEALAPAIVRAAADLAPGGRPRVVYHLDERRPLADTLDVVRRLADHGIVPCVENFHQRNSPDAARALYTLYRDLFEALASRKVEAVAVLDVPRIYHEDLGLDDPSAQSLAADVLRSIGELAVPLLLHLIDSGSRDLSRANWCPIGQGVIPYPRLFEPLAGAAYPLRGVVLEYEDKLNPLRSVAFLRQHLGG